MAQQTGQIPQDDKFAQALSALASSQQQQSAILEQLARQTQPREEPKPQRTLSEDDYLRAMEEGKLGQIVQEQVSIGVQQALQDFQQRQVEPLRQGGHKVLGMIAKKVLLRDLPYFDVIGDELEKRLSALPPDQQIDPDVIGVVHKLVVADSVGKIAQHEMQKTQEDHGTGVITPGGPGRTVKRDKDADPTLEELQQRGIISFRGAETIREKGGLAEFVRKACPGKSVRRYAMDLGWRPEQD